MDLTTLTIIFISLLGSIYFYLKYAFSYWKRKGVPHLEPNIPFGNVIKGKKTEPSAITFCKMYQQLKGKGPIAGLYYLTNPAALVMDVKLIKQILITDFQYFINRGLFINEKDDPLSNHLFSMEDDKWRIMRNKLSPTFTSGKMKFMFPIMLNVANQFEIFLKKTVNESNELEIQEPLARFATDVIGSCAFGIECNSINDANAEFYKMGRKVFTNFQISAITVFIVSSFPNLARKLKVITMLKEVTNFFIRTVRDTVNYRELNNIQRNDFMDILLNLKNSGDNVLTVKEITAQAFLFFLAGFEPSSTTTTFCLYELAKNPDIQEKVRNEIKSVIEQHKGFTYEAMMDMKYLDQVINETLRMYAVASITRKANVDYKIPGTDLVLEKGMRIFIPSYAIQRDPEYFPDPEKFLPERFSPEELNKRDNITFLAFGNGPRNCVGLRFGMMQVRIGLVMLLQNFEISTSAKTLIPMKYNKNGLVLSPDGGIFLNLKKI